MTVAELRKALEGIPDHLVVIRKDGNDVMLATQAGPFLVKDPDIKSHTTLWKPDTGEEHMFFAIA